MPANSTMPGTYALSFSGFNHDSSSRARFVAGVGQLVFAATEDGKGTVRGTHRATNSPMTGQQSDLHYSEYAFSGTYEVIEAGPPIQATINMTLTQTKGGNTRMSDTFAMVQSGPDRFRLISTNPRLQDDSGGLPVDELVMAELIKVDPATW